MKGGRGTALLLVALRVRGAGAWAGGVARAVAGGALGLLAGIAVTLGTVVARARLEQHYIESTGDLLSWQGVPIPLGLIAGGVAGAAGSAALAAAALGTGGGLAVGGAVGAMVGAIAADDAQATWGGGIMGGALGVLLGALLVLVRGRRRSARGPEAAPARRAVPGIAVVATLVALVAVAAAVGSPAEPEGAGAVAAVAEDAGPVESVVYLVGDPGKAGSGEYPILPRLAQDIDTWAERAGRDSAAVVLMLGDVVYPDGMHPPGTPGFPIDSARVAAQVEVVSGPAARSHGARMLFLAGNHDWGLKEDRAGARRLRNLGAFLDRVRARGEAAVDLVPPAGTGGPEVLDLGDRLRLILLDTAWWLFDAEPAGKAALLDGVAAAVAGAGERHVVVVGHHPFQSAGPHGGLIPFWRTAGIYYLLNRSGAMLQDLNSVPYRELREALGRVFAREGRPLAFVGGHEHSLQLIRHDTATAPRYSLVSGSASKLSGVRPIRGTMFQVSAPGYMRLVVRSTGAVDLFVEATPDRYLMCGDEGPGSGEPCMAEGVAAYRTVFSTRLVSGS